MEDQIQAGQREAVKSSEEATRRNVEMVIQFSNDTRQMVLELRKLFDNLQNHVMNHHADLGQLREQLAMLQQQFYARGTTSYSDGEK